MKCCKARSCIGGHLSLAKSQAVNALDRCNRGTSVTIIKTAVRTAHHLTRARWTKSYQKSEPGRTEALAYSRACPGDTFSHEMAIASDANALLLKVPAPALGARCPLASFWGPLEAMAARQ